MYQCYRGHSSHVTCVRFTNDHRFLISVGGNDKCIIQWRHDVEELDTSTDDEADKPHGLVELVDVPYVDRSTVQRTPLQVRA